MQVGELVEFRLIRGQTVDKWVTLNIKEMHFKHMEEQLKETWALDKGEKLIYQNPTTRRNIQFSQEPYRVLRDQGLAQVHVISERTAG